MKPWLDVESWQKRVDKITGLNKRGLSIVRLVWGQDSQQFTFGEEVPRYWTKRTQKNNKRIYYRVPRWIFELRLEPEQYVQSWEDTRYLFSDEQGRPIDKGPAPKEYFKYFMECADHEGYMADGWPGCCTQAFYGDTKWGGPRSRCWGEYRQPAQHDLDVIEQAVRQMNAEKFNDPYAPLTYAQLAEIEVAANKQVERAEQQLEELGRQIQREFLATYPYPGALEGNRWSGLKLVE